MNYDPESAPDPEAWLELNEPERIELVRRFHALTQETSGGPETHAIVHVSVETQLAEGHPAARAAMARLLEEGLDRHEALHAIGSVVAGEIFHVLKSGRSHDPVAYAKKLSVLTAAVWRSGGSQ